MRPERDKYVTNFETWQNIAINYVMKREPTLELGKKVRLN